MIIPDIDIDFAKPAKALENIKHIKASRIENKELVKHNCGVYLNSIPVDPNTGFSAIPYKEAEKRGYYKIDFLSLSVYDNILTEKHLDKLLAMSPLWEILEDERLVSELFQIKDHFSIINKIRPKSVEELAICIALIRPGKRYLVDKTMEEIKHNIWLPDDSGFIFKKSHAIGYALVIVVQMNLMMEELEDD